MTCIIPVLPRGEGLVALQFVWGETTATELREFAGAERVNVGIANENERDLRWVHINTVRGWADIATGEWIIRDERGVLDVVDGVAFASLFRPANADAAATLRVRDVNDPTVQEAQRIAASFAASLHD